MKKLNIFINNLTKALALTGSTIIIFILILSCLNIFGRKFNLPIQGTFEIIELSMAVSIFMFLPFCQRYNHNIKIEFFIKKKNKELKNFLYKFSLFIYFLISLFITWRLVVGGLDFFNYNDETMMLGIPKYIAYLPMVFSSFILTISCITSFFENNKW